MATSKKYKLFSANSGGKAVCAFYGTPKGCRLGDQCQFRHEAPNNKGDDEMIEMAAVGRNIPHNNNTTPISDTSSVVSSESSDGEIVETPVTNPFVPPVIPLVPFNTNKNVNTPTTNNNNTNNSHPVKTRDDAAIANTNAKPPASSRHSDLTHQQKQQQPVAPPQTATDAATTSKKRKRKKSAATATAGNSIFANPKKLPDSSVVAAPVAPHAVSSNNPVPITTNGMGPNTINTSSNNDISDNQGAKKKQRLSHDRVRGASVPSKEGDFRSLNLPITAFSTSGYNNSTDGSKTPEAKAAAKSGNSNRKNGTSDATAPKATTDDGAADTPPVVKKLPEPMPTNTEVGRRWQDLVVRTRQHANYKRLLDFSRLQEMEAQSGIGGKYAWIQAKPFGPWCVNHPAVIALDCEMCETQDPVSGAKDSKALCRVSIVNGENPSEVLLDTLVKPAWPIVDYRTRFHGITPQDLEPVQCTLRHVQAFLMALCSEETVMVGHALHNDLMSLKMEHYCLADSSFLFPVQDSATAFPSLKTLTNTFLKKDMPTIHDSVLDAQMALNCVEYFREHQGNVKAVERTNSKIGGSSGSAGGEYAKQLLVHRIPKPCLSVHLEQMFLQHTRVQPTLVPDIEFSGDTGRAIVHFLTAQHCNLAFDTLQGQADLDNSGRAQKKVYLRTGSYVRVRKMAFDTKRQSSSSSGGNSATTAKNTPFAAKHEDE